MVLNLTQDDSYKYAIDVEHFFIFMRDDIIHANEVHANSHTLTLDLSTNTSATYNLYEQVIRRRIQNQGHEIYLRNVRSIQFMKTDNIVYVELITINGEHYEKEFLIYE